LRGFLYWYDDNNNDDNDNDDNDDDDDDDDDDDIDDDDDDADFCKKKLKPLVEGVISKTSWKKHEHDLMQRNLMSMSGYSEKLLTITLMLDAA